MWQVIAGLILFFSKALGKMSKGGLERFEVIPPTLHFKKKIENHKTIWGKLTIIIIIIPKTNLRQPRLMKSKTLRKKIFQKSNRKELCINLFEDVKHKFHPISLSFQMGRNKLQNKLKRAKGRNITKVEESKESSPELDHLAR